MSEEFSWRTGRSCVFKNYIHLVFVTKYRKDVFTKEMLLRLQNLSQETCLQMNGELLEFNGEDDHVHLNNLQENKEIKTRTGFRFYALNSPLKKQECAHILFNS